MRTTVYQRLLQNVKQLKEARRLFPVPLDPETPVKTFRTHHGRINKVL